MKRAGAAIGIGLAVVLFGIGLGDAARADGSRPAYSSSRFNEDWSVLRDPSLRSDPFDPIKWIPLNEDGSWYATLGGELRARYESSNKPVFGLGAPDQNDYVLNRLFLFGDIHYGPHLRTFAELASGYAPGFDGTPPPTQENKLDLLQGFGELSVPIFDGEGSLRAGRQEMSFGSSRFVSVRESPNIRRSFDGLRVSWSDQQDIRIDGFLTRPVLLLPGTFDDERDAGQLFWGVYVTAAVPGISGLKADLYYLGLEREDARFAQGLATERRHTIGTRLFGQRSGFDWNVEAAVQFGSFGASDIDAWTVSSDIGYTFSDWTFSPRLGLNADAISGDGDLDDRTLGTFNPLFPKLPYFSEANLVAPANLLDIQPNLTLSLTSTVDLNIGWNPLWKESTEDAIYGASLSPLKGTAGGSSRFIGQQVSMTVNWAATDHLNLGGTYVHYEPGDRVREAGGRAGDFAAVWAQFLF